METDDMIRRYVCQQRRGIQSFHPFQALEDGASSAAYLLAVRLRVLCIRASMVLSHQPSSSGMLAHLWRKPRNIVSSTALSDSESHDAYLLQFPVLVRRLTYPVIPGCGQVRSDHDLCV